MHKLTYLFILLLLSTSCKKEDRYQQKHTDFFHVEINKAILPVQVRGNTASRKMILYINGGPGGTGLDVAEIDPGQWRSTLEQDFAMVYYDQRGIGNAQGRIDESSMTLEQYTDDIHAICLSLKERYPECELHIMGHSFGALLTYRYILHKGNENLVRKYIAAAGVGTRLLDDEHWVIRRSYVQNITTNNIASNQDKDYWQNVQQWLDLHPVINTVPLRAKLFEYMQKTQIEEEAEIKLQHVFNILLFSGNNFFPYYLTLKKRQTLLNKLVDQERKWDIKSEISKINKDILLLGGEFDINVPPQELYWVYSQIQSQKKKVTIIPKAGHDMFISQPQLYYQSVKDFINK